MTSDVATTLPERHIARVVIDQHMGDIHDWLGTIPAKVRNREVQHLIRLGFAVYRGHVGQVFAAPVGENAGQTTVKSDSANPSTDASAVSAVQDAAAADLQMLKSLGFNDAALFEPPPNLGA